MNYDAKPKSAIGYLLQPKTWNRKENNMKQS